MLGVYNCDYSAVVQTMASSRELKRPIPSNGRKSCETVNTKGHTRCDTSSDRSLDMFKAPNVEDAKEVSEAVGIMEEILNPSYANSDVKGHAALRELHKHSVSDSRELHVHVHLSETGHTTMQENGHQDTRTAKDETLLLADQSASEEEQSKVQPFPWVSSYYEVEELVREYEIETTSKYLMGNPDRDFGKMFDEIKYPHHVHLDGGGFGNDLSPRLCLDGMPYIMMGNRRLACHHGKPHYQSAKKVKGKQRQCIQASKKVGCPAHIFIRHVMLLPDFIFDKHKITEHRRRELSKHIKAWKEKHAITTQSRYYIEFPDVSSHKNHPLGEAAGIKQPIDKRVNDKMLQLISDGMKSVSQIELSIKDFVRDELFKDSPCPPYTNRRFFPTQKDITNRIFKVTTNAHSSKLKKTKLEELVSGWLKDQRGEDGFMFFRNVSSPDRGVRDSPDDTSKPHESGLRVGYPNRAGVTPQWNESTDSFPVLSKEGLLFIYQTRHQRGLLTRYGCDLTFLEPAHRPAAYAIPLFFLLVHTNCGYHIVGMITMERESVKALREALGLLKEANPSWSPQQFMVDACEDEIQTVENLFPDCQVFITDYRRQQAWERFLGNQKHGMSKCRQELLVKMAGIVTARTPEAYQVAMDALRGAWTKPALKQVRAWFREKWITNVQRWAYVYRQHRQMLPLIVNNSVEAQRKALVYPFITTNRHSTLHSLLDLLVSTVLPSMETRYVQTNEAWCTTTNSGAMLTLFHNRPRPFVNHCQQRIALARRIEKASVTQVTQNMFRFHDAAGGEDLVDLTVPSCTCGDFAGTGLPCAHLLACISDGNNLLFERLPCWYCFSPFLTIDKGGAVGGDQSLGAEDDECTVAVPGLSPEDEATSNLEAILAAVEAQTTTESTNPSVNPVPIADSSPQDEATRWQATARELLDLTNAVTDTEALAQARMQMEAALATLRQALPRRKLLHDTVCHCQSAAEVVPVRVTEVPSEELNQELCPAKRRRLDEEVQLSETHLAESEIQVVYDDSREHFEGAESIMTETIDLQQGAVFILEPSEMMRNVQIVETSSTDAAVGSVITKDS